jgi:transcriptional regulator with XRE-family HTH domain
MTQPELADRAGVSLAYVCMLEAGGLPQPGLDALLQVAKTLAFGRLAALLEEVCALRGADSLPPSVIDVATVDAVDQFLRESRN